jgi:PAS domain S-box-containing protein/putative nucleotidyltransferase with HDIG domain
MKTLYVEDDALDADLTRRKLKKTAPHIEMDVVHTRQAAIQRLKEPNQYELLLTDLRLPDGGGFDLLTFVHEQQLDLAVVVITGQGDEETAVAALKAGADDYMVKRQDYLSHLATTLEQALQRHRDEQALHTRPLHILFADANPQDVVHTLTHFNGHAPNIQLIVVPSAAELLARLMAAGESHIDVILLDYRLPDINGLEALKKIRQAHGLEIPIVLSSNYAEEEIAIQALRLGASDYIVKNSGYLNRLPALLENAYHRAQMVHEQAALRASEERYRRLSDNAPDIIYRIRLNPPIIEYINSAFFTISGYSPEECIEKPGFLLSVAFPEDVVLATKIMAAGLPGNEPITLRWRHKNGSVIWTEIRYVPILDNSGNLVAFEGIARDITERRQTEEALNKSQATLQAAFDHLPFDFWVCDENMRYVYQNASDICQWGDFLGKLPDEIDAPADIKAIWKSNNERALKGDVVTGEVTYSEYKKGYFFNILAPVLTGERVSGFIGVDIDITELKQTQEKVNRQLQRMNALQTIDMAITSSLDLQVTLTILVEHVTQQLRVDAAAVHLYNPHSQMLEFNAGNGFRTFFIRSTRLHLGDGYAGKAALERRTLHYPNLNEVSHGKEFSGFIADEGFITYYCTPLVSKGQIKGVLEVYHRSLLELDPEWLTFFEMLAGQAAIAIDNNELFDDLQRANLDLMLAYDTTLEGWMRALDLRDRETEGHTQRVAELTLHLARRMRIAEVNLVNIRRGALLHDIGKVAIPDNLLHKPGPLTDEEWVVMRKHPVYAFDMLSPINYLKSAIDIPYCHHEKWDGSGYPRHLKGEEIPLSARLFAVVDVWDALSSDRPYRKAWDREKIIQYLQENSGTHFDPQIVQTFLRMLVEEQI